MPNIGGYFRRKKEEKDLHPSLQLVSAESGFLFNNFPAVVIAAIAAYLVRSNQLTAFRAFHLSGCTEFPNIGTTLVLPRA